MSDAVSRICPVKGRVRLGVRGICCSGVPTCARFLWSDFGVCGSGSSGRVCSGVLARNIEPNDVNGGVFLSRIVTEFVLSSESPMTPGKAGPNKDCAVWIHGEGDDRLAGGGILLGDDVSVSFFACISG